MATESEILTPEQAAKRLKVSKITIRRLLNNGILNGFKVGCRWRIDETDLKSYIREQKKRSEWNGK